MTKKQKENTPVQVLLTPKYILVAGKILTAISPFLASRFAAKLFLTPHKYKLPEREKEMDRNSSQIVEEVPGINREIVVYRYGDPAAGKKVLLAHGWSGRGTQMPKLAAALVKENYEVVSFDAPGHGKAPGKMSMMPFFIEAIHHLDNTHGPFHAAIGHSLGGMSLLRAAKEGLALEKLVIIGTANSVTHITYEFARNMKLNEEVARKMKSYFDEKYGMDMDNLSGAFSAESVNIPTLVVHDKNDVDVHFSSAYEIRDKLKNGELFLTEGLGHRKILGDQKVINKITTFIAV
ncbi:alpha/beta hydrolase [Antarcticibacterium flavum]|uniref:Alpha/beta hydrolase n=1 Tax=Antarcticibacterium flavum TaxID=2058175 RepID=A0A5B7WYV3_9FLAO|nr:MULTISPECIES: alpha/beta hydrolase [Antarcticibacterium]MCM4161199.1 alpha/beta hydrolase [Antarcticibacterium sp. W02-3]QCY68299.1 alpha/beta hydrolase [Antarcticibacterium flavum]